MDMLKRTLSLWGLAFALSACTSDDARTDRDDAGDEQPNEVEGDAGEEPSEPEPEPDAAAPATDTVPLTVWVDDLIEHRTSDEAVPDTVDDKKISDDTDETSFDKYLP